MKERTITMTPQMAEKYLQLYHDPEYQRHVIMRRVEKYANDMRAGRWPYTGDPIRISDSGKLIDGQHRLMAIILSNKPVKVRLMEGVPSKHENIEMIAFFDRQKPRNLKDDLSILGKKYPDKLGNVVRVIYNVAVGTPSMSASADLAVAHSVIENYERELDMILGDCLKQNSFKQVHRQGYLAAMVLGAKANFAEAGQFNQDVVYGEGLKRDMPAYALRELLIRPTSGSRQNMLGLFYGTLNSFKRYLDDKPLNKVKTYGIEAYTWFTVKQKDALESVRLRAGGQ